MAGENSNEKHEEIFEHEFEILQRIKEHFQVTSDKDSNLVEYKILGENYEQLLRQSIKLMKIGDSTQRRLIKTQNQLQEANDQIEKSYNNLKALSQFGQSITASLDTKEIIDKGIGFISLSDNIDFSTASGKLHFQILCAFAEFERELIRERTIEGLNRTKSQGKTLGRPKGSKDKSNRKKSGYYLREMKNRQSIDEKKGVFKELTSYE